MKRIISFRKKERKQEILLMEAVYLKSEPSNNSNNPEKWMRIADEYKVKQKTSDK